MLYCLQAAQMGGLFIWIGSDEAYAATTGVIEDAKGTDQRQFLPGDGRSIFAGLEWKW